MELKTEENTNKSTGLRLAGTDGEEIAKKEKAPETEVWDFSQGADTVRITSAESALKRTAKENKHVDSGNIIVKIMGIVIYAVAIAHSGLLCWIAYQGVGKMTTNLYKFQGTFTFLSLIILVDAIMVNILFERKISLFVVALLLPFLYPGMRTSHVKGSGGFGSIFSLIYFLSLCGFFAFFGNSYLHYGAVILLEDEGKRTIAIDALDEMTESGKTLGDILAKTVRIEQVGVEQDAAGNVMVGFAGSGMISLDQDTYIKGMTKSVPTELVFVKSSGSGTYELRRAALNGKELTERGITNYWKLIAEP
ncbi:MAG: hypothetical protein NC300_04700 [Bacteroidales bacterium]|nr:hypothetical protein [Clostridium sp.]MCM1203420.1 hypothetical protein [Bacteroidales bacterium]